MLIVGPRDGMKDDVLNIEEGDAFITHGRWVRNCYEWQINNFYTESREKELQEVKE